MAPLAYFESKKDEAFGIALDVVDSLEEVFDKQDYLLSGYMVEVDKEKAFELRKGIRRRKELAKKLQGIKNRSDKF